LCPSLNIGGFVSLPENRRTFDLTKYAAIDESRPFAEQLVEYLESFHGPVTLGDMNRRFGVVCGRIMGRPLRELLREMERDGLVASRFNLKRKKTYVYGPEAYQLHWDVWQDTGNVEYWMELEEQFDPRTKRKYASGAAKRKARAERDK
jgi:hypothetical protein